MTPQATPDAFDAFVANLRRVLEKNGFPTRRVALPLERLYESAYERGLNFNKVLEHLAASGVAHEKTADRILFAVAEVAPASAADADVAAGPFGAFLDGFPGALPEGLDAMMAMAAEMMKTMSPEQLAALQAQVASMSEDERAAMMDKARELGFKTP
jgi:hypothetical protein